MAAATLKKSIQRTSILEEPLKLAYTLVLPADLEEREIYTSASCLCKVNLLCHSPRSWWDFARECFNLF